MKDITFESTVYMLSADDLRVVIENMVAAAIDKKAAEDDDRMLSTEQASKELGVNKSTLWHWRNRGYLTPVRVGRYVRYRYADIKAIKEGRRNSVREG